MSYALLRSYIASDTTSQHHLRTAHMKEYVVYIMASRTLTLYVGVTNDIRRRTREHKEKRFAGFSARYNVNRLLYYEMHSDIREAIAREKQIKVWRRDRKIALVRSVNPELRDLGADWM